MALIQRNDVNQIFGSQAPDQDKPAQFNNYTGGWDASRINNGKPTIKQFNYLQQRTDQNILYIHQNGGALPYDSTIEYAENATVLISGELKQKKGNQWVSIGAKYDNELLLEDGRNQRVLNNELIKTVEETKNYVESAVIQAGAGVKQFSTEAELKAFIPSAEDPKFAFAFDTSHSFEWVNNAWVSLGPSDFEKSKDEIKKNNEKLSNDFVGKFYADDEEIVAAITDTNGNKTWLQASKKDGLPTEQAKQVILNISDISFFDGVSTTENGERIGIAFRDSKGKLTALATREEDGMFLDPVIENIKERLNIVTPETPDVPDTFRVYDNNTNITFLSSISSGLLRHINDTPLPTSPYYFVDSLGQGARIWLPTNYDDSKPIPLLMVCDGVSSGTGGSGAPSVRSQWLPLLEQGIAICKSQAHGNSYGNAKCMQSNYEVFKKACEIAPIGAVVITGNSMGAIAAQNLLLTNTIPNVSGLYLTDPTYSLRQRYDGGRYSEITAAYELSADGSDYAEKTKGHDPALRHWSHYRGLPVSIRGSSGDNTVPLALHGSKLKAYLAEHNDVTYVDVGSSGHSIADRFITEDILKFIENCTKYQ